MTAPTTTLPAPDTQDGDRDQIGAEGEAGAEGGARCGSCPHPLAAHDPIGLRFCRATRAGDIHRGCVCRVA